MLAARDQENRVFRHSVGGAAGKPHALGPKTPGTKYPNTPLKVPLNDGNATVRMAGGNENFRTAGKAKSSLATPLEPRTARAPLGNKTTNAKAHALQQQHDQQKARGGVKDIVREIEKSQQQQAQPPQTGRRPKAITPRNNTFKLSVLSDANPATGCGSGVEEDIEHAPPRVRERPYESDVFPSGVVTFAALRPENRLRGYYDHYFNPVDDDGVPLREKELEEQQRRAFEKLDIRVQDDLDSFDWTVGDVPASREYIPNQRKQKLQQQQKQQASAPVVRSQAPPPTIVSRKAASALALPPKTTKPTSTAPRTKDAPASLPTASVAPVSILSGLPLRRTRPASSAMPLRPKSTNSSATETASRTTLGYNKGRTALSLVRGSRAAPQPAAIAARGDHSMPVRDKPATEAGHRSIPATPTPGAFHDQPSLLDLHRDGLGIPAESRSPAFLSIFEVDDERCDLGGAGTFINEDLDDGFQMDTKF